jgi:hypothetical protein
MTGLDITGIVIGVVVLVGLASFIPSLVRYIHISRM